MKNSRLKKAMSIIVAFAMVLTMATSVFAEFELQALWVDEAPVFTAGSNISAQMLAVTIEEGAVKDYQYHSTYDASKLWDGSVATEASPTTTIDGVSYYQISDGADLAWFANQVNTVSASINAVLTDDIYLNYGGTYTNNWNSRAIGTSTNQFLGTFDGDGYTISGLYSESTYSNIGGLFKYIGAAGTVKDLVMKDVKLVSGCTSKTNMCGAAAIAAQSSGTIENCAAYGNITSTGSGTLNGAGGLVGFQNGGKISGCYSEMNIISEAGFDLLADSSEYNSGVGGIVAKAGGSAIIEKCGNGGTINVPKLRYVAGVIGFIESNNVQIIECYNTADITGGWAVAGIAGTTFTGCVTSSVYNTGAIHSTKETAAGIYAGGVASGGSLPKASYTTGVVSCDTSGTSGLAYSRANATSANYPNFIYPEFGSGITWPIGQSPDATGIGTKKTLAEIKTQATVDTLNGWTGANTYKIISSMNDGYPVFTWQN